MLRQILQGWRADAAIALAPIEIWIEALKGGFHLGCPTEGSDIETALNALEATVAELEYQPEDLLTGQGVANYPYHPHHGVRQYLSTKLLLVLEYWREYRIQFHIAASWGISESAVCRLMGKVETLLMNSGKFRLPGKKQLCQNAYTWKVLVVDVTESPIERPKKTASLLQW